MSSKRCTFLAGMALAAVIATGSLVWAQDKDGGEKGEKAAKGASAEAHLALKTELAKKFFFGLDVKVALKEPKDIDWVPDTTVPAVQQGTPVPALQQLGVSYKILLNRAGYITQVPESFVFQSGDQFRVLFQSNTPATVQILHKGTSGNGKVLFPDPRINGGANTIPAYQECAVPPVGWFRFDEKPGTEELIFVFTPQAPATGTPVALPEPVQQLQQQATAGAIIGQQNWNTVVMNVVNYRDKSAKAGKSKDIVYVDEGQSVIPQAAATPAPTATPAPATPEPIVMTPVTYVATTTVEPAPLLIHTVHLNHK